MRNHTQTRHRTKPLAEINVVPYIDVMLVLLVIFMVTAPLFAQGVKVALPEVAAEPLQAESQEPLVLTLDAAGRYYLNVGEQQRQAISDTDVLQRARAVLTQKPTTPVLVEGDQALAYGRVVSAMILLQQAGAKSIGLVTQTPESAGSQ